MDRELAEGTVRVCVLQVSCDRSLGSRKQRYERGIGRPGVVFRATGLTHLVPDDHRMTRTYVESQPQCLGLDAALVYSPASSGLQMCLVWLS